MNEYMYSFPLSCGTLEVGTVAGVDLKDARINFLREKELQKFPKNFKIWLRHKSFSAVN